MMNYSLVNEQTCKFLIMKLSGHPKGSWKDYIETDDPQLATHYETEESAERQCSEVFLYTNIEKVLVCVKRKTDYMPTVLVSKGRVNGDTI